MQHHSTQSSYNLRSEAIPGLILISGFLSVFTAAGTVFLFIGITENETPALKLIGPVFIAVPLLILLLVWRGYYRIRITDGNVSLQRVFKKYYFSIDQIRSYATDMTYDNKNNQQECLYLSLKDGQMITLYLTQYNNWAIIKGTFTRGVHREEALLDQAAKRRKWVEFVSACVVLLVAIVIWLLSVYNGPDYQPDALLFNLMFALCMLIGVSYIIWKYWEYTQLPPK